VQETFRPKSTDPLKVCSIASIAKLVCRLYTTLKKVICFNTLPFGIFNYTISIIGNRLYLKKSVYHFPHYRLVVELHPYVLYTLRTWLRAYPFQEF
jgi:hypothetical protein